MNTLANDRENRLGLWYGIAAYTAWGILPLYWKLLDGVGALEILAHRIIWSFVFTASILLLSNGWVALKHTMKNKHQLRTLLLCGVLISGNWFTYIWAVNSDMVVQASMGYYMNPLVVVLLAVLVLKERINGWQRLAIALAAAGVLLLAFHYKEVPWVALILATSFALYGLVKKLVKVDPLIGLAVETMAVLPVALMYLIRLQSIGRGSIALADPKTILLLVGAGAVTATPLLLFAQGVQKTKLSMMGFLQYIAPTISLLLGIFVFKEPFFLTHVISFALIWLGLVLFTLNNFKLLPTRGNKGVPTPRPASSR